MDGRSGCLRAASVTPVRFRVVGVLRLGMATGGWLAGVMYDHFAFYTPAFAVGVAFNLLNLVVIGALVVRHRPMRLASALG